MGRRQKVFTREDFVARRKSATLKYLYGIDSSELEALINLQDGRCIICGKELDRGKFTHVDHDPKTRVVRGILCSHCNQGLGHFLHDPKLLMAARDYLVIRGHK